MEKKPERNNGQSDLWLTYVRSPSENAIPSIIRIKESDEFVGMSHGVKYNLMANPTKIIIDNEKIVFDWTFSIFSSIDLIKRI